MSQSNFRIVGQLAVSLGAFVSLLLQLHGIILMWKMHELRRNEMCLRALLRRRRYFLQKIKRQRRRILGKRWYKPGRTDLWWQNILRGISPEECYKKNFRMRKGEFDNLVAELRPYISPDPNTPNHRALSPDMF